MPTQGITIVFHFKPLISVIKHETILKIVGYTFFSKHNY